MYLSVQALPPASSLKRQERGVGKKCAYKKIVFSIACNETTFYSTDNDSKKDIYSRFANSQVFDK